MAGAGGRRDVGRHVMPWPCSAASGTPRAEGLLSVDGDRAGRRLGVCASLPEVTVCSPRMEQLHASRS